MPNGKDYWLQETYRNLELALADINYSVITAKNYIEIAIECLEKYEKELKNDKKAN